MKALFVDTAGWVACADAADSIHARCCAARDDALEAGQVLVTTDFVVDETLTLLRFRLGLAAAARWWQQIDGSSRQDFSFTDCTSFVIMREARLTHVLTTDRHFRQMGFQTVPGPGGRVPRKRRA